MSRPILNQLVKMKQRCLENKMPEPLTAYMSPKFAEALNKDLGANGFDDWRKLHGHTLEGVKLQISEDAPAGNVYMKHKDEG